MSADDFQRRFSDLVFAGREPTDQDLAGLLEEGLPLTPGRTLEIYRNSLIFGIRTHLQKVFPDLEALLGEENFRFFAREYARQRPPARADIRMLGDDFGAFLATRPELEGLPWLPELTDLLFCFYRLPFAELSPWLESGPPAVDPLPRRRAGLQLFTGSWSLLDIWQRGPDAAVQRPAHLLLVRGSRGPLVEEVSAEIMQLLLDLPRCRDFDDLVRRTGFRPEDTAAMLLYARENRWLAGPG